MKNLTITKTAKTHVSVERERERESNALISKTKIKHFLVVAIIFFSPFFWRGSGAEAFAQNIGINTTGATPNASALLDVDAAPGNNKGLLIPRMTTAQRDAIVSPAQSLLIYNITTKCFEFWENSSWQTFGCACTLPAQPSVITGTTPVCQGNSAVAYSVTNVGGVTYTWTYSGTGYTQASGGTTNSITADFSGAATSGTLTVTPSNACGNGTARTLAIAVSVTPTTANAGSDINPACGVTTATLAGNTATVGTGAWSVVSGTATITTSSSPTSGVTGLAVPGTATLRWTISNSPCTASTSDVVITTTSCCGTFVDARDSKTYNAVLIGTQCWMKENLNFGTYAAITTPQVAGTKFCQNLSGVNDAACPFGGLYEWTNMMNGSATCNGTGGPPNDKCATNVQGLCPAGWHVPSHYEWTTLEKNVGTNPGAFPYDETTTGVWLGTDEGGNLKQTGTTNWTTPNTGATNTSGFLALPGGNSWAGSFYNVGSYGDWWSATESGGVAWNRNLKYTEARVNRNTNNKATGFSVRCVKD